MKRAGLRTILLVCVLLAGLLGFAQAEVSPAVSSLNLTPEQWVGYNFVFLDLPADKRADGYEIYTEEQAEAGFAGDRAVRIPYAAHVGKQVTVTAAVARYGAGDYRDDYVVHMTEADTGKNLVGRTMSGQLEGLVLADDLRKARQQFLGKTVYVKRRMLEGAYDPRTNPVPLPVNLQIGAAAQVVDVYAGLQACEPVWLIVSFNGQKAILPIAYSWTNRPVNTWTDQPPWQKDLYTEDPRATMGWSPDTWKQIEDGVVQEGMIKEQVLLSWGPPAFTYNDNKTAQDVWNYGTSVLRFTGDRLAGIESVDLKNAVIP
ncbi:MAG TPA: hypothetical protein VN462_05075 [Negativicutes bacterium]|nr:hypothetical protein [Negativicutes bacterium]